ncbi:MAG TPA: hypothetical protein VH302_09215 [Bryobacteraceae bacterium]|nr:hypothetical protein [Bryobacteraceae bacterium]
MHCRSQFHIRVKLPYAQAFALFGAWKERDWDPDWRPRFVHPEPARDQEGAVFVVDNRVWINTCFDVRTGHVQYAHVRDKSLVTRIDICLGESIRGETAVTVVYERTALDETAAAEIAEFARTDPQQGREWERLIEAYIRSR